MKYKIKIRCRKTSAAQLNIIVIFNKYQNNYKQNKVTTKFHTIYKILRFTMKNDVYGNRKYATSHKLK